MSICSTAQSKESKRLVMSVNDACYALNCSRDKLYQLLNTREIKSYLDGRSRKIWAVSVEAYVIRCVEASEKFERARHPKHAPEHSATP